jgi:hypothetical protein
MSSHKVIHFAFFSIYRGPAAHQQRRSRPRPPPQLSSPRRGRRVHALPPTTLCCLQDGHWMQRKLRCQRHGGHQEQCCCSDVCHPHHHPQTRFPSSRSSGHVQGSQPLFSVPKPASPGAGRRKEEGRARKRRAKQARMMSRAFLLVCLAAGSSAFSTGGHSMVKVPRSAGRLQSAAACSSVRRSVATPSLRMSSDTPEDTYSDAAFMVAPVPVSETPLPDPSFVVLNVVCLCLFIRPCPPKTCPLACLMPACFSSPCAAPHRMLLCADVRNPPSTLHKRTNTQTQSTTPNTPNL